MTDDDKEMEIEGSADDVRAAIAQLSKDPDTSVQTAPSESAEVPESSAERPRDASGKFIKSAVEPSAPATETTDADRLSEQPAQQSNAVTPPTSWSADAKATWSSLPTAAQQAALKREAEISDGQRQWSERENIYRQAIAPASALSQQYQMPENEVIKRLVGAEQRLQNDAPNAIRELAQAYGVDLAALVNGSPQPQRQQPNFDPNIIPQIVEQTVSQRLNAWQQDQALNSEISSFAAQRGTDGQSAHPHFEAVKQDMGLLLQAGKAQTMQEAYDKAIWLNPETRPQPQIQVNSQQQVAKSRRAAVSVNGAPQNGSTGTKANGFDASTSTRDDVREAIRLLQH